MILRLSEKISRGSLVCVALLAAASLSFFSIRAALASRAAGRDTVQGLERATRLEPGNARNWYLLGRFWQYNMEQPDSQRAIQSYQTVLSLDANSSEALLELGTVYEAEGDLTAARAAFVRAKKSYPASSNVSWRYGNFLLRRGEQQPAFAEIRTAVLADPKRTAEAFSRLYRANPDADSILNNVLPATQVGYLDVIADLTNDRQTDLAMNVWNRLVLLHPRLTTRDVYPMVNNLLIQQQFGQARRVWDEGMNFTDFAAPAPPEGSVIWDGGFESGLNGADFAWQFAPLLGEVQTSFDSREKHSGRRSLRTSFDGRRNVSFENACTRAVVQPATPYLFSAWVQTKALTSDQGIAFRLRAVDQTDAEPLNSAELHGTQPWTRIEMPWTSGSNTHMVGVCLIREASDQPEGRIKGTAWVDDVALTPRSTGYPKP